MSRWGYYPLILIGSWTFGTINRIHNFVDPHHPVFALYVLQIATSALMVRPSAAATSALCTARQGT